VIDASSSMLELTAAGRTKLSAAIAAAGTFLDQLHFDAGDQAAVVSFNADAALLSPPKADRATLDTASAQSPLPSTPASTVASLSPRRSWPAAAIGPPTHPS
jgi:hypothetical protein